MANRLDLNFALETNAERAEFVRNYIERPEFKKYPLTNSELETISNYILWGKDPATGKNVVQEKFVQIETKNKTWDTNEIESLDALMESPSFNEATLKRPTEIRPKVTREVFDRKAALSEAPKHLIPVYTSLFRRIDELDLAINFYDFAHGRRKKEPRSQLLNRFLPEEQNRIYEMASHWNQFKYLKQRHELVELRREQFTLRDSYKEPMQHRYLLTEITPETTVDFESNVNVRPLGLRGEGRGSQLVFREIDKLNPWAFTKEELEQISKYYWAQKDKEDTKLEFDFRNLEHVYQLFLQFFEMRDDLEDAPAESNSHELLSTLEYYVGLADLTEVQREILELKMKRVKNQDIADKINGKYGKSYTANYISTIFRQKIIPKINEIAAFHDEIVGNLFFEENFKKCGTCGRILLMSSENFVKKTRSKDGFSNRCKRCDHDERQRKKVTKK